MPTLYEIFTGRWGAEKDAKIAELETENAAQLTAMENSRKIGDDLESQVRDLQGVLEQERAHSKAAEEQRDEALKHLAPFREYVAATDPEAPEEGNGDDGEGRAGEASGC